MAYRRPGITVTQEFVGLSPALAAFALPSVVVGPAFQLVDNDVLGSYSGSEHTYAYASLLGGAIVDLSPEGVSPFPATEKKISVKIKNAEVLVGASTSTGSFSGIGLSDATTNRFSGVAAGDIVVIEAATGVTVVSAQTNGSSVDTAGLKNRLTGTSGQYANVKVGDSVVVTGGTNARTGTYTVSAKVGSDTLVLSGDVNNGSGPSTNTAYSITGSRGQANAGRYKIKSVTDANNVVLQSPVPDSPEALVKFKVIRKVSEIPLARVQSMPGNGYLAAPEGLSLPSGLQYALGSANYDIISGSVVASYRALRTDLASEVKSYANTAALVATFGAGQITPANPLAYGLSIMLQNTVTAVNGLGLSGAFLQDEALSYTQAADVLKMTDMYAIAPLSGSPVVHTLLKNHCEQLSAAGKKKERIVIINSRLPQLSILQEESVTSVAASGARSVLPLQLSGSGSFASGPAKLSDATTDQFASVQLGDKVVISAGSGLTAGTYSVISKADSNNITLSGNFITSGTPSGINYSIYRDDGVSAGGGSFYDRSAQFITNGVAPGHQLNILSGSLKGRYRVASVVSEKELTLSPAIQGAVSGAAEVSYQIDRNLTRDEQATQIGGYSGAFASRRVVHCWPDIVKAPVGQNVESLPGFYLCCSVAALITGLPTQQGLTNLSISGFLGFEHSTRYFNEDQLDTIAGGGTMIFSQEGSDQPLFIRHQLTTDRSAIKFQELSITKNVDFISKFLRTTYAPYVGQYNITDTTLDGLRTTAQAVINYLKDSARVPKFGGVIRSGSLVSIAESTTQLDTVEMRFSFAIPVPLNSIDITVQV